MGEKIKHLDMSGNRNEEAARNELGQCSKGTEKTAWRPASPKPPAGSGMQAGPEAAHYLESNGCYTRDI